MAEIRWDIRRGASTYKVVHDARLKKWISTGKIKRGEVIVWRSGFSGWRKPEELDELTPFFRRWERQQLKFRTRQRQPREILPQKTPKKIKNILIVDDEKDLCLLLSDILTSKSYNVASANTKREAIACLKRKTPDLAFLDLKLSDGDGLKVLSKIKEINSQTIVNIISAYGSPEIKEKAKKMGARSFIDKPFTEASILNSIGERTGKI